MKLIKPLAVRSNDGHVYRRENLTPANGIIRKMAEKVLHERAVRPKTGKGSGIKKGEARFANRRFSGEEVLNMRRRHAAGERIADLAREFNVHYQNMLHILNGTCYSWAPFPK